MANPKRKMAVIKRIDSITPIEGADRIELAHIGGWQVVVGRNEYSVGDLCVYYEPDSFLPADDERYADFATRGTPDSKPPLKPKTPARCRGLLVCEYCGVICGIVAFVIIGSFAIK